MSAIVCACGKSVEEQPDRAGQWITCPGCGSALYCPFPGAKPSAPVFEEFPTRLCSVCAETIPASDVKCKFCGADPNVAPVRAVPIPPAPAPAASDGGLPSLVVGLVGYMVCGLLCPVAWMMGKNYEADCKSKGIEPSSAGKAGKIIGLIGSVFLVFNVLFFFLWLVASCL